MAGVSAGRLPPPTMDSSVVAQHAILVGSEPREGPSPPARDGSAAASLPLPLAAAGGAAALPACQAAADRRCLGWLALFLLVVYLLTMAGRLTSGDGETMYATARALVLHHHLSIEPRPEAAIGRRGLAYGKYGLAQSIAQAPFIVVGHLAGTLFGAIDDRPDRFAAGMTNAFISVALAAVYWRLCRLLGWGRGPATAATLILGLATLVWPYARADFSEPLQATSLLLAFCAFVQWRRRPALRWAACGGAAAGLAFLTKAASAILLLTLGGYFALAVGERCGLIPASERIPERDHADPLPGRRPAGSVSGRAADWGAAVEAMAAATLPFLLCVLFQAALNLYRFGSITEFGYGSEPATGFTTPLADGIRYLLLSPGKGLLLFAPPVVLGLAMWPLLARRFPLEAGAVALVFVAELVYYSRWWAWHGDWSWGPRYLYVTVPFLMLGWGLLLDRWRRVPVLLKGLAGLLAGLGFLVAVLGSAIDYGAYYSVVAYQLGFGVDVKEARLDPAFSPLLGHAWLFEASLYDALSGAGGGLAQEKAANPFLRRYPWAWAHPDLQPDAPEQAIGFDYWFAALRDRPPFVQYWSALVAWWLAVSLLPLGRRVWSMARVVGDGGVVPAVPAARETDLLPQPSPLGSRVGGARST